MVLFYSSSELEREMWWTFTVVFGCWGEINVALPRIFVHQDLNWLHGVHNCSRCTE